MTVSDIGKIVFSVAVTEFLTCILSRKIIFQSESYLKTSNAFERAKSRRDKTAASLATKKVAREEKPHQTSQKSIEKEGKKLQRENEELSALAAEVARRHTMAGFYSSVAFLVLYRILAAEYAGKVVALLPFEPFHLLQRITFRGLSDITAAEVHSHWVQFGGGPEATTPGGKTPIPPDVQSASQACSFAFMYVLCSLSVKMMVNAAFGTKPPPGADDGVGTLIEAPQNQKMMKNFGLNAEDVKEARRAVGFG
mmetsp:Transcript_46275/g.98161  ORF Transcript_46275/g.98161 Transcript_46275/m.98161 type:complete len:253 (-) Transcript_46275:166-924(-)|eukprot:CAMPEP_0172526206 /NCGR_PEP_ID=MMETSP1067-20121228/1158_1 /TAXON_ID=265564 ORGANISM="Thalassiosira punctigera, Strain Tpunct2005C2" /NCGR_SAMPLE_ID=MMETSP1067 /ASSEMBLY_ACC=CAM_ASM_000444 /LENGTH=252 /DNA_ID=CAMNT_0013309657 /DNA_START=143 /DNA_END=901 /DNA_ORIENTATION=+